MPSPQDYATRREAYAAWLTGNAIDPGTILMGADVTIVTKDDGSRVIAYEGCDLTADGHRQIDEHGTAISVKRCETPLLVEPPDWWKPYVKPARDDLLDALERLWLLAPELELEATLPGMHDAAREAKRDASRRMRAIISQVIPS